MKDYKRLTERDDSLCIYCADIRFCRKTCIRQARYERLQFLENEIESGELCDREEVRKETAQTCIILAKQYQNSKEIVRDIAEKYDIDLENEE